MSTAPLTHPRPVLADLVPVAAVRNVVLVVAGAALTAAVAQITIPLPFTPVPISGTTFAVLLVGAALGPARGAASLGLYWLVGLVGMPVYADASGGLQVAFGATGGYLVGFIVAAAIVGALARRGLDRKVLGTAIAFVVGSLVIYAFGVPWLMAVTGMGLGEALVAGVAPFLIGDALKALLAAGVLPAAWKLAHRD